MFLKTVGVADGEKSFVLKGHSICTVVEE